MLVIDAVPAMRVDPPTKVFLDIEIEPDPKNAPVVMEVESLVPFIDKVPPNEIFPESPIPPARIVAPDEAEILLVVFDWVIEEAEKLADPKDGKRKGVTGKGAVVFPWDNI